MRTVSDIRAILYLREDRDSPMVERFRGLSGKDIIECADEAALDSAVGAVKGHGIAAKEAVILRKFPGRMFQKCPGSPGMICCNYLLVNIGFNCLYNCTYCYLNYYLNSYGLVQFINVDDSLKDIGAAAASEPEKVFRIGSGEYTDSLMMDDITGIGAGLIREAARYRNVFLELKTKSSNIGHLLDLSLIHI